MNIRIGALFTLNGNASPAGDRKGVRKGGGKEVLLVFPGRYRTSEPQIPLSLLHVAYPLQRADYKVRIFDMRLENIEDFSIGDPIFVGISAMSGIQIHYALTFAKKVRTENPSCPIIWGGVHPSLLPEQTVTNECVDAVVRGEAESMIVDLANRFENDQPLEGVAGVTYKTEGRIKSNPDSSLIDLDDIPLDLPYNLLSMDKYPAFRAGRFHIQTSRGCPHNCGFCYNSIFNKRKWRGKTAKRVLDEIEFILGKFPHVKWIDPVDDNFFVDKKRVEDICTGMIKRGIHVKWRANCRFDYLSNYDKSLIGLLMRSGCAELDFGGETGSDRLLSLINKDVTSDQMIKSVQNLKKWAPSIEPYVSWMSGLPTETDEDLKVTFNLMDKMREVNEKTQHFGVFIYTPFPSPVAELLRPDFKPPKSLEEWGNIEVFQFNPPWHSKKYVKKLHAISAVSRYAFYPGTRLRERAITYRLGYSVLNRMAKFRWHHRFFGIPVELKIVNEAARKLRGFL